MPRLHRAGGRAGEELDEQVDTVVQPDVFVVCDAGKLDRRGVRAAPDFVVEVPSPATASHDYLFKHHAYERAGVREYWLVHPADRMLTSYRLVDGRYGEPVMQELAGTTPVSVLPGVVIAWSRACPNPIFEVQRGSGVWTEMEQRYGW